MPGSWPGSLSGVAAARLSGATQEQRSRTFATLVSAFRADPVERWLYPDDREYEQHFPAFLDAFGGQAFGYGTVWQLNDFAAVALWFPPSAEPDGDAAVDVLMSTVDRARHPDTLAALEQMAEAHPRVAHWYLPWFGVDADLQGAGLGGQLMAACLQSIDSSAAPAYLETPNPRTIRFYERNGFRVSGRTDAGACPPITFMVRSPANRL